MITNEPIAIVGSGCRLAGDTDSPSKLWQLLREPRDLRKEITPDRFSVDGFYHPEGSFHGHSNVRHAYLMDHDPSRFDASFFGIKPSEAKSMDPQQRLLLEVVYESIEAAGMTITELHGSDTAVYAGLMTNDYGMMLTRDLAHVPTYHATGISSAIVSNRISYFFDWHGPSMTVDTGCSASLVALHLAVQSLRNGESRMAVACGTNLILGPEYFVIESKLKMLSPDGRSKMWDQEANGYARGDGVTSVVLKTLSAALANGDHIECLIRETGLNQDGSTPGITMPSAAAQEALIRSTYAKAGLDLQNPHDRPQYFEAHGTGTPAGDPIEAEAINKAFFFNSVTGENTSSMFKDYPLYVGSIKTVLGHTEGSAGLAAIVKASLALQNHTIPPNLLFNKLSDRVAPFYDNLEITTAAKPWPKLPEGQVRRASVNSFGFGGANAHAILESYQPHSPKASQLMPPTGHRSAIPFVFSASSGKNLKAVLTSYANYLSTDPDINIEDLAWTLCERRALFPFRVSFSAGDIRELATKMKTHLQQDGGTIGTKALVSVDSDQRHGILGVFTGQGAQYVRMGAELIEQWPQARRIIKSLEMMLSQLPVNDRPSWSLRSELLASAGSSRVHQATISQPLCTAVQIMLVDLLKLTKVNLCAVVGHSSGEIAAAYAAGFLTAREAIYIAYYRGLHLESAGSPNGREIPGAMLAVGTSMDKASELCTREQFIGRVSVAASNSSSSVTISGDEDAIVELQTILDIEKTFNRRLKVDKAYHSAHMKPCGSPYINSLETCVRQRQVQDTNNTCLWYSSVYDKAIDPVLGVSCNYWAENMANPVLFSQALTRAATSTDFEVVVEVGAHPALKGPASQTIGETLPSAENIPYLGMLKRGITADEGFSVALGRLWSLLGPSQMRLWECGRTMLGEKDNQYSVVKGLPSYPWDHSTSFWHEARASRNMRLRKGAVHPLLGDVTPDSTNHHFSWRNLLRIKEIEWLSGHAIQGQVVFPAAGYICSALEVSRIFATGKDIRLIELADFTIHHAVVLPEDDAGVEVLVELVHIPTTGIDSLKARFTYSAAVGHDVEVLTLAASATIVIKLGTPSPSLLPPIFTASKLQHATKVDTDSFYSALAELGYNFAGPFRSLSQLERKHQRSSSFIHTELSAPESESLLIHPAALDAAFQAILLACSYPNDEQLRNLHLPTSIGLIRVDHALCSSRDTRSAQLLPVEGAIVGSNDEIGIIGDVSISSPCSPSGMIQMQGIKLVPFGGASAATDDRQLFSTTHWISNSLHGSSYTPLDKHQHEGMTMMERISAFYLRRIDSQLTDDDPLRSQRPLCFYLAHAHYITSLVSSGMHGLANKAWQDDTLESVARVSQEFSEIPDIRIAHLVGEHMPRVLKGETTMIEEFRKANILGDYYTNGAVINASASWIIGLMKQLVDHFPQLNILEIGAGSGEGVTSRIPSAIDNSFLTYTYANVSGSIQPDGTAFFSQVNDPKPVLTVDLEQDPTGQGYVESSYDVIIAFWIMHATKDLNSSLRNIRKLLRPGGYLIIAEGGLTHSGGDGGLTSIFGTLGGWWLGADQGRTMNPYLSAEEWDGSLKSTGFSGVELAAPRQLTDTFGAALLVSQAIDEQVAFLKTPVSMLPSHPSLIEDLIIVGGKSSRSSHLADGLHKIFAATDIPIHRFDTLEEVDYSIINNASTVISLTELDRPVFLDITESRFLALKQMFGYEKKLLWVTSGRTDHQPYCNLTLGFGRTAVVETPGLLLQQLDIHDPLHTDASQIADVFLRFVSKVPESTLWNTEPEIIIDEKGAEMIPRLKPIPRFNDRHNSSSREIKQLIDTHQSHFSLQITKAGWAARNLAAQSVQSPDMLDCITSYSTSSAIKTTVGQQFLVLCRHEASQKTYVTLTASLASTYQLSVTSLVPFAGNASLLDLLAAQMICMALLNPLSAGSTAVAYNATGYMAIALKTQASFLGINLVFLSDSTNIEAAGAKFTPYLTQYQLNKLLPSGTVLFIGLSASEEEREVNESAIMSVLPLHCRRESVSTMFSHEGLSNAAGTADALRHAINKINSYDPADLELARSLDISTDVGTLVGRPLSNEPLEIIDWTKSTTLPITVDRADNLMTFRSDRTYWVIGLSTALGASLFDWMIQQGARNLVFSRRRPDLDAEWVEVHKRNGVRIEIVACDLTDEKSLKRAHAEICASLPPIAGVMNGAAVFRDTSILDMSFDQLQDSLAPKVLGTINLDRIFYHDNLDFFILTSSITGLLGSEGQANYAAANTFMCGIAAQRRKRGLAATTINLGAIAGVGMLERSDKKVLESIMQRLSLMPVSEGDFHQIFAEAIEAGHPNSLTCGPELTTALRAVPYDDPNVPGFFSNPMFSHFRQVGLGQKTKASKGTSTKELLSMCETETELRHIIQGAFSNELRKVLHTTTSDEELMEMRSIDLGIDSLVSIDLRSWFTKNLKVSIPVLKIMGNDPTGDLVTFALGRIPSELVPMLSNRDVSATTTKEEDSIKITIDWDVETTPPADLSGLASVNAIPATTNAIPPNTVVLTGASGFLGRHILQALLEQPTITRVHCVAMRRLQEKLKKGDLPQDERIAYYEGELHQPRLGLSEVDATSIFAEAHAVIHNGADTSHLKSYFDLKPSNIESTLELVRLCLPRRVPLHFVSSNAVGRYSNKEQIGEVPIYSPGAPKPPTDGSSGYRSTKWAAETLLEQVHKSTRLPIWIHRPSTIIRTGKDAEGQAAQLDWMNALIWYMDKLSAVPKLNHGTGFLDLVHAQTVRAGIVSHVMKSESTGGMEKVLYVHHMADLLLPLARLEDFSTGSSRTFRQLPREQWTAEAVAAGMHSAVVVLIEMMDAPDLKGPPMFVKGPGSPSEPLPN